MPWTPTVHTTGLTGNGVLELTNYYEAIVAGFTNPIPAWYGRTGSPGRVKFFDIGWISVGQSDSPAWAPERLIFANQLFTAPRRDINRVLYWFAPGVEITIYTAVWT